jgi:dihydrofolate synthase/folylpolyglutamate synthase
MDYIIVTGNSSPRAMLIAELEKMAQEFFGADRVFTADSLSSGIEKAMADAKRPLSEDSIGILITGSVVSVGEARTIIRKKFAKEG